MANTLIQLKHSLVTPTPPSLNVGEPAYSYSSNTLFIGSPDSTGSIAIGGKFYLDQQQIIFNSTNAAFSAANTAAAQTGAFNHANAAFSAANTAQVTATSAGVYANGAFVAANTADSKAVSAGTYANGAFVAANTAQVTATSAGVYANGAFVAANTAQVTATSAGVYANGAFEAANAATTTNTTQNNSIAAAFTRANNSINANTGGTITGSLVVTGNLTIQGNTTFVNTEVLSVEDSLIKLANNQTASDVLDIGFYGQYDSSGQKYAGLARPAATDTFFLFKGLTQDPTANALASGSVTAANAATLIANVAAYSVTIGGQDIQLFSGNAYAAANTADNKATSAGVYANGAFVAANTADNKATSAGVYANGAFVAANTADNKATSAGVYANGAFAVANTAAVNALSAGTYANGAFAAANTADNKATSAGVYANGAFAQANTDFTNISTTAADHGSASAVAAFRVEANGRISSANTTAIAIGASAITSGTLGVTRGGTGAGTFTNNGVLLGQGTSTFTTASSATEGHVLTINASGVPTFAHLQGGTF